MPRQITQYRIFIGSPGGLREEREAFRRVLTTFNEHHGEPNGIVFAPVGWEDTLGGIGRPQELINEDLRQCDFAVFVFHDRWGSPTGKETRVGTEEEWELVQELYGKKTIRKVCLFFKHVDESKLADPGQQLQQVLRFKAGIEQGKKHLFLTYSDVPSYCTALEKHVANWMREIAGNASSELAVLSQPLADDKPMPPSEIGPSFSFWLRQSRQLSSRKAPATDKEGARYCAEMALKQANTDAEWADAESARAEALHDPTQSFDIFSAVAQRLLDSNDAGLENRVARALFSKAFALSELGRSEEAIVAYDDVVSRFGASSDAKLRETVARALFNKGVRLGQLGRNEEAIAVYKEVASRFATASEATLREDVACALVNIGGRLGQLGRREEAIKVYDDVVDRFGTASGLELREAVGRALFNSGVSLGELGHDERAIAVYDDLVGRFGPASEIALREQVARSLVNKAGRLGRLGRDEDAIKVYDDVARRFENASEIALREATARAFVNKGARLEHLNRAEEAIALYDDVVGRFGMASEAELREQVGRALVKKMDALALLGRREEAVVVCNDIIGRFGSAREAMLRESVHQATVLLARLNPKPKKPKRKKGSRSSTP